MMIKEISEEGKDMSLQFVKASTSDERGIII